jgi:endoglucanase
MKTSRRSLLLMLAATSAAPPARAERRLITGVNLAGLEFNSSRLPGERDRDYVAPGEAELDYYHGRGARAVRLPFLWERLQPELGGDFDREYWRTLESLITAAGARQMHVILDAHQYGRRRMRGGHSAIIGESADVTAEHFAAFWGELANRLKTNTNVIFGLVNEPHDQRRTALVDVQNRAIAAIRGTGARQLVLVSGDAWSGAHSWVSSGSAQSMLGIADSAQRFAFDVHQYLDQNSSGTGDACVAGSGQRLTPFTNWAREHGKLGFLGEFGAGRSPACATELSTLLRHVAGNRDVWIGWTYWAGGPWWPEDYALSVQPASLDNARDRPQMSILQRYFE